SEPKALPVPVRRQTEDRSVLRFEYRRSFEPPLAAQALHPQQSFDSRPICTLPIASKYLPGKTGDFLRSPIEKRFSNNLCKVRSASGNIASGRKGNRGIRKSGDGERRNRAASVSYTSDASARSTSFVF